MENENKYTYVPKGDEWRYESWRTLYDTVEEQFNALKERLENNTTNDSEDTKPVEQEKQTSEMNDLKSKVIKYLIKKNAKADGFSFKYNAKKDTVEIRYCTQDDEIIIIETTKKELKEMLDKELKDEQQSNEGLENEKQQNDDIER